MTFGFMSTFASLSQLISGIVAFYVDTFESNFDLK